MHSEEGHDPEPSTTSAGADDDDDANNISFRGAAVSTTSAKAGITHLPSYASTSALTAGLSSLRPPRAGQAHPSSAPAAITTFVDVRPTLAQGEAASQRYRTTGARSELDAGIRIYWNLHLILMPQHPDYFRCRYHLCILLSERFDLWGSETDINKAVELGEELHTAERVAPKDRVNYARACARALCLRFDGTTQAADAARATELVEEAESLPVDGSSVNRDLLIWHGRALYYLYEAKGDFRRLQEAIRCLTFSLTEVDDESPCKPMLCLFLSEAHRSRQDKLNERPELEKILIFAQKAVDLAKSHDPRRPRYLNALAIAWQRWSMSKSQDPVTLQRAVEVAKEALACVRPDDRRYTALQTTTANGLRYRYHLLGNYDDINECVSIQETSLAMRSEHQKGYNAAVYGLHLSLLYRFRSNGALQDIDRSIAGLTERCDTLAPTVPIRVMFLNVLSMAYLERWWYYNRLPDLHESLRLCKDVVEVVTGGGYMANVGVCYYELYLHSSNTEDLELAIDWMTRADGRRESIYDLPEHLLAYGKAYLARAQLLRDDEDWSAGLQHLRSAVDQSPPGHKRRAQTQMALAHALLTYFRVMHDRPKLEESLQILHQCLDDAAAGLEKAKCRILLADALAESSMVTPSEEYPSDILSLMKASALDSQALFADRFTAALKWARLAQQNLLLEEADEAYGIAVSLLPRVAWLGYGWGTRLQELRARAGSLAVDAAAAAIAVGRFDRAVELLESGRGIFWRQLLQLRTEVDELQDVAPKLSQELQEVGRALEADVPSSGGMENEYLLQRHRRLAEKWEQLVAEVRNLPGFEDFLQATKFTQLSEVAKEGPIIVINGSTTRVDALILTPDRKIYHCPLPGMQARLAIQLAEFLRHGLNVSKDQRGLQFMEYVVRSVLERLWHTVVSPIRNCLTRIFPNRLPNRIWLLPTGPFCLLPIHAAGFSASPAGRESDIVCSYTVTLAALIRARKRQSSKSRDLRVLAISQAATPGQEPLLCSKEEMEIVKQIPAQAEITCLCGDEGTVNRVCEDLQNADWVHLSCHGNSNPENPLLSCFRFFDGPLSLSDISKLRLPHADFAFLSACHTARPAGELPDESLHLAASLQLAGFKSVVATQWGIADKDAPVVTREVYQYMFTIGERDFRSSAEALHQAVAHLKRSGLPAIRWVPFVHLGI